MLEFMQFPIKDFYDKERIYILYHGGRYWIELKHSSNTCEMGVLFEYKKIAEGIFVEEHGLAYIAIPEPIFYK